MRTPAAAVPNAGADEPRGGPIAASQLCCGPTAIASARAKVLPTQRFLLAKGAFIDCTLETAINSTLPGMTTCITATDTFSSDGTVVLLERGTKLIGETRGQVLQGAARVFVLWDGGSHPDRHRSAAWTSPGLRTNLGRSGLAGEVNRHFWDRFGAAILISTLDGCGADGRGVCWPRGRGGYLQPVDVRKRGDGCFEEFGEHSTNGDQAERRPDPGLRGPRSSTSGQFMSSEPLQKGAEAVTPIPDSEAATPIQTVGPIGRVGPSASLSVR